MGIAIRACELTKYYGTLLAVDHISFEVMEGEFFGFLGPNGAGKTTTIRMLTGLTRPSEGEAYVFGYNILKETLQAQRLFGVVPEVSNVYTDLTVWDNLMFMGELYGVSKSERIERGERLLKLLGLLERRNDRAKGLSKGLKRRLVIAMALIHNPKLLFLDEPTSGLDVRSTRTIRNLIRKLNSEGVTVFLTTHNMEEANVLCDRVAIIYKGKIVTIDTPERLKQTIQSIQSVVVSFNNFSKTMREDLKKAPTVYEVRREGDKFRLYTPDPHTVIEWLCSYVKRKGLKIISLNTVGPSLEDVYLKLTGGWA
ncbi:MAG TPA: ATP-binding cassette domain-containing protein [Thermoproteales archaeon]|nr:ATP-binding cassette domain-containing protein [Thermoproteales archaeon]